MSELIKVPTYRKFLETKPITPRVSRDPNRASSPPWRVYVQREVDGKWGYKDFWKYSQAFKFFRAWLKKGAHDATINNKRVGFDPPQQLARIKGKYVVGSDGQRRQATKYVTWKLPISLQMDQPEHHWCKYCRRPTVFKIYSKHPRLGEVDPGLPRCCICGASARIALTPSDKMFRIH